MPNCRAPDFDTKFQLINGSGDYGDYFTVAFNMQNVSGHACVLDRGSYGANGSPTYPDRIEPWGKVFVPAGIPRGAWLVARVLHRGFGLPWQRVLGAGGEIKLRGDSAVEQNFKNPSAHDQTFRPLPRKWPRKIA